MSATSALDDDGMASADPTLAVSHVSTGAYRVRRSTVFRRADWLIYPVLTVVVAGTGVAFFRSWADPVAWRDVAWVRGALTAWAVCGFTMYVARWLALPLMRRPVHRPPSSGLRVGVATTFVPDAEPLAMLEETVRSLIGMEYPHDTWVLDEGDDPAVQLLCQRLGAHHFTRRHNPEYRTKAGTYEDKTKHGNYNAWLAQVGFKRYDVIVNFDPDHIPAPQFLNRVLGYFEDPSVGYVQAAQVYYNQSASVVARGAAEETYAYYASTQMTSYALGYPIVTGCHTAHRVEALRAVGGFAAHEADDLLITVYYRATGWTGVYVPEDIARGLVPVDWAGYLRQQRRWARSVLDVKIRQFPKIANRLGLVERLVSFCHGLHYLSVLGTAAMVVILTYLLARGTPPKTFSTEIVINGLALVGALQLCEFYRQRFFINRAKEWGLHLRSGLVRFAKWPYVALAVCDALRSRHHTYLITRKTRASGQRHMLTWPHLSAAIIVMMGWLAGTVLGQTRSRLVLLGAVVFVVASLGVCASELRTAPEPFDPTLANRWRELSSAQRAGDH